MAFPDANHQVNEAHQVGESFKPYGDAGGTVPEVWVSRGHWKQDGVTHKVWGIGTTKAAAQADAERRVNAHEISEWAQQP